MTGLLIAVTLMSLALAGALLTYVLRLTREERDRSDARAAALAERLDSVVPPGAGDRLEAPATPLVRLSDRTTGTAGSADSPADDRPTGGETSAHAADPSRRHLNLDRAAGFLTNPAEGSATPRFLLVAAIGLLIVGIAVTGVYVANRPRETAVPAAQVTAPLELLSLRHERTGDTLIVSGLVGNPEEGQPLTDIAIVIRTFDRAGAFLAAGNGAVDFRRLEPGDQSPFVVRLPGATDVGRYRVTFRTAEGVMPHVDRRSETSEALARGDRR